MIIRDSRAGLRKIFPAEHLTIDPSLVEIREWICPKSGMLLDGDCVPRPHRI